MIRIGVRSFVAGGPYTPSDADALAFVNAAGITDDTQKLAVNTLVTDLKGYGIWSKMKAIYPFVGGTSSTHKWNLKDPRDLDAAFRLVFSGGWTHSNTGALPNGTNAYGDTKITPSISLSLNNTHLSYYSRSNISITSNELFFDTFVNSQNCMQFYFDSGMSAIVFDAFNVNNARASTSFTRTDGLYTGSTTSSINRFLYRNNININTNTSTNTFSNLPNIPLFLAAANTTGGPVVFSNFECAFASIGDGLTDTEAANLYTAVQAYQTSLSRNV